MGTIALRFDARHNSLNFLRLVLALSVIVSHAWSLGGYGTEPTFAHQNLGTWAVGGFFAISGYLIANSRLHLPLGTFLIRRARRIYPGYLVCILVIAVGFAPLSVAIGPGSLAWGSDASFVLHNLFIKVFHPTISNTLPNSPYGPSWDGSLWTLIYEVFCYVGVGMLLSAALRWHRALVIAAFLGCACVSSLETYRGDTGTLWIATFLAAIFFAGSLVALYADRIPLDWRLFVLALVIAGVGAQLKMTPLLGAFGIAYTCLWLGIMLPFQKVGRTNDISYGVYIYAFPVQQIVLVCLKADRLAVGLAVIISIAATIPFAAASWFLVEKRALARKPTRSPSAASPKHGSDKAALARSTSGTT